MSKTVKKQLGKKSDWLRFFFMVLFAIVSYFSQMLIWIIALFQFIASLITKKANGNLERFGSALGEYVSQIFQFLAYSSDKKPYPFDAWPKGVSKEVAKKGESEGS